MHFISYMYYKPFIIIKKTCFIIWKYSQLLIDSNRSSIHPVKIRDHPSNQRADVQTPKARVANSAPPAFDANWKAPEEIQHLGDPFLVHLRLHGLEGRLATSQQNQFPLKQHELKT